MFQYKSVRWFLVASFIMAGCLIAETNQVDELLRKAEIGDAEAQYELGLLYTYGAGVERDVEQAIYWHRKSADQGYGLAQKYLDSLLLEEGKGTVLPTSE